MEYIHRIELSFIGPSIINEGINSQSYSNENVIRYDDDPGYAFDVPLLSAFKENYICAIKPYFIGLFTNTTVTYFDTNKIHGLKVKNKL